MAPTATPQDRVNDFVIKLANVNGTGSASANTLLMKSIFRMGVPVMGKNYFPSNIQGLPTWYEIRISKDGYVSRSGRVDVMVAMNAETYAKDVREVSAGGFLIFDSDVAALGRARPRRHHDPRRAAREALQRELRGRSQPHPDEEHHVCGAARSAARDRCRGDPPAAHRELREKPALVDAK
jgi:Pyruvate/2-oxoacid:ferredoxin oxidoreductase gamma subunit